MSARGGWHAITIREALERLEVVVSDGLSSGEVELRLNKYGPNELPDEPPVPLWRLILQQFDDLLVKMLLAAAMVSTLLAFTESSDKFAHALVEPFVILLILVLNAIVGVWQESNAEKAIEALKEYEAGEAEVRRDGGAFRTIKAADAPQDIKKGK